MAEKQKENGQPSKNRENTENAKNAKNTEALSLEELFERLEEVTAGMEKPDVTLEQSFSLYNQGMQLLKQCNEVIDTVEKKVQILDEDGESYDF